jgi:hypothetical protein
LKIAATDAHAELLAAVDEHRPAWAAKVSERIGQRKAAVREAIDALVASAPGAARGLRPQHLARRLP